MKIVIFVADFAAKKRCRAPQTMSISRNGNHTIVGVFCMLRVCDVRRNRADFQIFARKIARNSSAKLRSFAAELVHTARKTREEARNLTCTVCGTCTRLLHNLRSRWVRGARNNAIELHRKFYDLKRKS